MDFKIHLLLVCLLRRESSRNALLGPVLYVLHMQVISLSLAHEAIFSNHDKNKGFLR